MKYMKIILSILFLTVMASCQKELLDKYPLDEISSADFFRQTNDMKIYMNQFYNLQLLPFATMSDAYDRGIFEFDDNTDNEINQSYVDDRWKGTRTVPASGGGWDYGYARSINFFFDNYKKCEDDFDEYKQYVGEAHFFRALIFYQLLQRFGDVVWYGHMLSTNSPELYEPRSPRNEVMDKILADLDSAAMYLPEGKSDNGLRPDKWVALAYQSRFALYEGTWEKYHAGDPFGVDNADPDKYLRKAVEAAEAVMNSGRFSIYSTGHPEKDYNQLFILRDYSNNPEIMFWKKFSKELNITNYRNIQFLYPYGTGVTKGVADSYLCTDGKPVSVSPLFGGYDTIADEIKDRDPRFVQTIWTPDAPWMIEDGTVTSWGEGVYSKLYTKSKYSAPTGYVLRKGYDPDVSTHDLAGEDNPAYFIRYAEVLLNYAEAKAELGEITQEDIDRTINVLRDRVGMIHLDMNSIETDPSWDFPDLPPIINEIRRERRIELVCEGFRWNDIARWAGADELIVGKRPRGFKPDDQFPKLKFPVDENGFIDPLKNLLPNGYGFDPGRDYLDPLPVDQLTLNPQLKQNPGWPVYQ